MPKRPTYILEVDSLDGEERTISVTDRDGDACRVYAVIGIGSKGAVILDNGYRTREEAREAWPEAK